MPASSATLAARVGLARQKVNYHFWKYHDESARGGRTHRVVVLAHPLPKKPDSRKPA